MFAAKKLQGAGGAAAPLPSDPDFNSVSFLSHFDGANNGVNNVFDDGSASNHTITANGNVTQGSFGPFARPDGKWGVSFDGAGDYLTLAASSDFAPSTGAYTVEFFINTTAVSGWLFYNAADNTGIRICIGDNGGSGNDGKIQFNEQVGNTDNITNGSTRIDDGQWHHVAISRVASAATKLYIDGTLDATGAADLNLASGSNNLEIGRRTNNGGVEFVGTLSNLRFVKGTGIYTGNFTPSTSPLTAVTNTKLLTCQSNRFVDNSASAHTLTPAGNPSVSAFSPFAPTEAYDPAVNGASGSFGSGNYLTAPSHADFTVGTGDFTVEFWIYPTDYSQPYMPVVTIGGATGGLLIMKGESGGTGFGAYPLSVAGEIIRTSTLPQLNSWTHVLFSRSGTSVKLFYNGVEEASSTSSYDFTAGDLTVGSYGAYTRYWGGNITNLRYVKGTATVTSNFTPPTAPLTAITNTKLLLNMADGQAIDSAAKNNLTLADDVKLSTAQAKFGNTSMLFDGSGKAYIEGSKVVDFGSGDFTVEFFMNSSTGGGEEVIFDARNPSQGAYFDLELDTSNRLNYLVLSATRITSSALSTNTWYHVAVCRSGTSTKMFIDGTQAGSTYSDSTVYLSTNRVVLGGYSASASYDFDGYLDEIRVSKTARYTSDFTPPTEPFLDQ
tara:strand:- start:61 stop:2058 length:1998 start_codon:yes stop_codon:yes gene_type:complete